MYFVPVPVRMSDSPKFPTVSLQWSMLSAPVELLLNYFGCRTIIIIIRHRQVVRPHRLPRILKVYLSICLLHLRGPDTQAGSMGTTNPDIHTMVPPSKIENNVTDHSSHIY